MRDTFLPFGLPDVGHEEAHEIRDAIISGWITNGPKTRRFESEFAAKVGAKHAIAVNSGTAALHLALEALGLEPNDEVITSPYTFAATAEVIRYFRAKPVFVDIQPDTLNLDPAAVEKAITHRTRALLPVHIGGLPVDLTVIQSLAQQHNLFVIEDAAHAFPAHYKGEPIGSISDMTCFSFYATKTLTTAEGGMICTQNSDWADRCRLMSLHGINRDTWDRYASPGSWYYEVVVPGFKYNMNDIAAAMGLVQLRKADAMWQRRCEIAQRYDDAFGEMAQFQIPTRHDHSRHARHLYILRLHLEQWQIDRDRFIDELQQLQIGTSVHFIPLHIHAFYRDRYGYTPDDFPVAYREFQRAVSLPIYSRMTDEDVTDVIDAVHYLAHKFQA